MIIPWDVLLKVIEQQGIVAGLLLVMIFQQWGLQNKLLSMICTLEQSMIDCLKNELKEHATGTWVKK